MRKLYIVRLTKQERVELQSVVKKLKGTGQKVRRAQILLQADADGPNWTDERIAEAYACRTRTVERLRQRFVEQGFEEALNRIERKQPPVEKLLTGDQEARIIATRLGPPPKKWPRSIAWACADSLFTAHKPFGLAMHAIHDTNKVLPPLTAPDQNSAITVSGPCKGAVGYTVFMVFRRKLLKLHQARFVGQTARLERIGFVAGPRKLRAPKSSGLPPFVPADSSSNAVMEKFDGDCLRIGKRNHARRHDLEVIFFLEWQHVEINAAYRHGNSASLRLK
jgi:hypothetical protein